MQKLHSYGGALNCSGPCPVFPLPMNAALPSSANMTNCFHTPIFQLVPILQLVFKIYSKGQFWVHVYLITVIIICLMLSDGFALIIDTLNTLFPFIFLVTFWGKIMETFCLDKFNNFRIKLLFATPSHIGLQQDCFIKKITRIAAKLLLFLLFTKVPALPVEAVPQL